MMRLLAGLCVLGLVAGCGGGGSGSGATNPGSPITTGNAGTVVTTGRAGLKTAPPGENAGQQLSRAELKETDHMVGTNIRGVQNELVPPPPPRDPQLGLPPIGPEEDPPEPIELHYEVNCADAACSTVYAQPGEDNQSPSARAGGASGVPEEHNPSHAIWFTDQARAVWSLNGITVIEGTMRNLAPTPLPDKPDIHAWGAWMEYSWFRIGGARTRREQDDVEYEALWRHGLGGGTASGQRPERARETGSIATWKGVMLGTPQHETRLLVGDAELRYGLDTETLDAIFTKITDASSGRLWRLPTVFFDNVEVDQLGTFDSKVGGLDSNYLTGAFYGPGHEEAVGAFEQGGVMGVFGAKRQGGS